MGKHLNMNVFVLKRKTLIDKTGRPAILLHFFGKNSLVWCGTTVKKPYLDENPFIIKMKYRNSYFYDYNIYQVPSYTLRSEWTDTDNEKVYVLTDDEQKRLISKFSNLTNQKDPYQTISELELENQKLEEELQWLKQEKEVQKENQVLLEKEEEYEYE